LSSIGRGRYQGAPSGALFVASWQLSNFPVRRENSQKNVLEAASPAFSEDKSLLEEQLTMTETENRRLGTGNFRPPKSGKNSHNREKTGKYEENGLRAEPQAIIFLVPFQVPEIRPDFGLTMAGRARGIVPDASRA
jgi:hypothetical protein